MICVAAQLTSRVCEELFRTLPSYPHRIAVITVRRYALHGFYRDDAVCTVSVIVILSVRPSVRPSVTLVDCVHIVRPTIMISSPQGSPIILVSADITFIPKFEGGHPERGR